MHIYFNQFLFTLLICFGGALHLHSNYNYTQVSEMALIGEPIMLPVRLLSHRERVSHWPKLMDEFTLKKYELYDTDYKIEYDQLSRLEEELIYNMEPPSSVFQFQTLSIENYKLLEIRPLQINLNNPSQRFRFCVNQILVDTEEVKRVEQIKLPHCISPIHKSSFNFTLYVTSLIPRYVRATIYFIIEIYDKDVLVDQKIYARRIYATVTANHYRIEPSYLNNCPASGQVKIKNYEGYEIIMKIDYKKKIKTTDGITVHGEVYIAPTESIILEIEGRNGKFTVYTKSEVRPQINFPALVVPIYCQEQLNLDFYNIGLLTDERMVVEVPISLSNSNNKTFIVQQIMVEASSETVEVQIWHAFQGVVLPLQRNVLAGIMRIYSRKKPEKKSYIEVSIKYLYGQEKKIARMQYIYAQIRQPLTVGQKRFIDVTKLNKQIQQESSNLLQNRLPIRNNLNLPFYLVRIFLDESMFKISWLQDRRNFIYPNHNRQQFLFTYIGPSTIPLSSIKYILFFQFNGHINIPLEIIVYDHTLQCLYENVPMKCSNLSTIDYGYFKDRKAKSKQVVLRNWNPENKNVKLGIGENCIEKYGINATLRVYGPLPNYQSLIKKTKHSVEYYLKGQHFLVVNIDIELLPNATSALIPFRIISQSQNIVSAIKIRVENGTIALIPQIVRLNNAYTKTIDYLNLVSTFSQKYQIKNISTNLSNLKVYSNNFSQIHENQWVGMTIVYEPFANELNVTYQDWNKQQFFIKYINNLLSQSSRRFTYVKIRLTTTTDLEVNSTVIIDNNPPNLILDSSKGPSEYINEYKINIMKRSRKVEKGVTQHQRRQEEKLIYESRLKIHNAYPENLKYKIYMISEFKKRHLAQYKKQLEQYKTERIFECYFCISTDLKLKYSIYSSTVKHIFRLQYQPEELIIEQVDNSHEIYNQYKQKIDPINNNYFLKSIKNNNKNCFKFYHTLYIKRLIEIEILNHMLEKQNYDKFSKFLKNELKHYESFTFEQYYDEIYHDINLQFNKICKNNISLMIYKFCHFLKINVEGVYDQKLKIVNNKAIYQREKVKALEQSYILLPNQEHQVVLQLINPLESEYNFYIIVVNNYTSFETYQTKITLLEPKLQIQHLYLDDHYKILKKEFQDHYFNDQLEENQLWKHWNKAAAIPIYITKQDYEETLGYIHGKRIIEVINEGDVDIAIDHIGIADQEFSCISKGIVINGLNCGQFDIHHLLFNTKSERKEKSMPLSRNRSLISQPFLIKKYSKYNITIYFKYSLLSQESTNKYASFPDHKLFHHVNIYLYDSKNYYFKLTIIFKIGDKSLRQSIIDQKQIKYKKSLLGYILINIMSFVFICAIVTKLKDQEQNEENPFSREENGQRGQSLLKQKDYEDGQNKIGVKSPKKSLYKPVQYVTVELLKAVKELKNRDLKMYFNESEESDIFPRNVQAERHNLSISNSISYEQDEREQSNMNDSSIINRDLDQQYQVNSSESLPEGSEVSNDKNLDEDSLYDFNSSTKKQSPDRSSKTEIDNNTNKEHEKYYNVFSSELSLKKAKSNNPFPFLENIKEVEKQRKHKKE